MNFIFISPSHIFRIYLSIYFSYLPYIYLSKKMIRVSLYVLIKIIAAVM